MLTESKISIENLKSAIFKGGKALFLRHVAGFLINFTGSIIIARLLGPEILGLYFISYTAFLICRGIIDFGIKTHFIRLPSIPSSVEYSAAFTLQQGLGIACLLITILIISPFSAYWYGHEKLIPLIASAGIGAYFYSWHSIPLAFMERRLEYQKVGVVEVGEILIFNLAAISGAFTGSGILGLASGNILRGVIPALLIIILTGFHPYLSKDKKAIISLIKKVYPIFGSELIVWTVILAPPILVGTLAGTKDLGIAQLSYNLLNNTMLIATIFQRTSLAFLSRFQEDMESFNSAVQHLLRLLSIIYIPLTMGFASLSPWWVPLIYGQEWAEMGRVILVGAIPITASALFLIFLSALLSKGFASLVFRQNIIHAVIYWIVMGSLATSYGALSVPLSHLIAMTASYMFIQGYTKYCGRIDYKHIISGFIAGLLIMGISWNRVSEGNLIVPFILWPVFITCWFILSSPTRKTFLIFVNSIRGDLKL